MSSDNIYTDPNRVPEDFRSLTAPTTNSNDNPPPNPEPTADDVATTTTITTVDDPTPATPDKATPSDEAPKQRATSEQDPVECDALHTATRWAYLFLLIGMGIGALGGGIFFLRGGYND